MTKTDQQMREEFEKGEQGIETLDQVRERKQSEENKKWVSGAWIQRREQIVSGLEEQFGDMLKDMSQKERRRLLSGEVMKQLKMEAREKAEEANYASPEEEVMYTHTQELEEKYQETVKEIENAQATKRRYPERNLYIPEVGKELDKKVKEFTVMVDIRKPAGDDNTEKAKKNLEAAIELGEHKKGFERSKEVGEVFSGDALKQGMSEQEQEEFAAWMTERGKSGQDIPNEPAERLELYRKETEEQMEDKEEQVA